MSHRAVHWIVLFLLPLVTLPAWAQELPSPPRELANRIAVQRVHPVTAESDVMVLFADGSMARAIPQHVMAMRPRVTPALSPDGRLLAFAARDGAQYRLFAWAIDTENQVIGNPMRVTTSEFDNEKFPAWSPDGMRVAYIASNPDMAGPDGSTAWVRVMTLDGDAPVTLATVNYTATPSWHPDGHSLLFIDVVDGKPVLKSVHLAGGKPIGIHPDLAIFAASYAPDGKQIAALVRRSDGLSDLWVIAPYGTGGKKIVEKISGAKNVTWSTPDAIMFNATRLGESTDQALWTVTPSGQGPRAIATDITPTQVANFTARMCNLSLNLVTPFTAETPYPANSREVTLGSEALIGPLAIASPSRDQYVYGKVPIRVVARPGVATVSVTIGRAYSYAGEVKSDNGETGQMTCYWDTQQIKRFEPPCELPRSYQEALQYQDGIYVMRAQAFDRDGQLLGGESRTIILKNSLPSSMLPPEQTLAYKYSMKNRLQQFTMSGQGIGSRSLFGRALNLNANLHAMINWWLVDVRDDQTADIRTALHPPAQKKMPLIYGKMQTDIPESYVSARYAVSTSGDFTVVPQLRRKIYLPLSQVAVPFPGDPVQVGDTWSSPMFVVPDLLGRQAVQVVANNVVDGVEMVDDRPMVRIRGEFTVGTNQSFVLPLEPARRAPGIFGGVTPPSGDAIKVASAKGVRFAWFDYHAGKLQRVEDIFLYGFPLANVPEDAPPASVAPTSTPGTPTPPGTVTPRPTTPGGPTAPARPGGPAGPRRPGGLSELPDTPGDMGTDVQLAMAPTTGLPAPITQAEAATSDGTGTVTLHLPEGQIRKPWELGIKTIGQGGGTTTTTPVQSIGGTTTTTTTSTPVVRPIRAGNGWYVVRYTYLSQFRMP